MDRIRRSASGGTTPGRRVASAAPLLCALALVAGLALTGCQLVCAVVYDIQVPRAATVQVTADAGKIVLTGLAGQVTAKADVGLINATGLTGGSVSLTTGVGAITADFAVAPDTIQAVTRVGAINLQVPAAASYTVTANATVGQATIQIPQSPSAAHTISATTDVGAIVVTSADNAAAQSSS